MTALLSTTAITQLQTLVQNALPDTATLSRATKTVDAAGGISNTWTTVGTYACLIVPFDPSGGAAVTLTEERLLSTQYWRILLPAATPVTLKDRLIVATRTFEVRAVGQGVSAWEVMVETVCAEVL